MLKPIKDFPDYTVSTDGSVYHNGVKLTASVQPSGYIKVYLYKDKKRYVRYLHRLVAEAFIQNEQNLPEVNHLDKDKQNCAVENLEWSSRQHNMEHGKGRPVCALLNGYIVARYKSLSEAARAVNDKSNGANIHRCLHGKRPTAYGYEWIYEPGTGGL